MGGAARWAVAVAAGLAGLAGCDALFDRAERKMARADAELRVYCQSLRPGAPWSPDALPPRLHSDGSGGARRVVGAGVAVCEVKLDAGGRLLSAEYRPD